MSTEKIIFHILWLFQGTSLFGANKPAFGTTPVTSTTGFGQPNLFGANKPAGTGLFDTPGQTLDLVG
jgi:hypothetical protein